MESRTNIICIVGKSGSGKTLVQNHIKSAYSIPQVTTITTRPPRPGDGSNYTSVSDNMFEEMKFSMIATTVYGGFKYGGIVIGDAQGSSILTYVIDESGIKELIRNKFVRVWPVIIKRDDEKRRAVCLPERFERDNHFTYEYAEGLPDAHIIENNGSIPELLSKVDDYIYNFIYKEQDDNSEDFKNQ